MLLDLNSNNTLEKLIKVRFRCATVCGVRENKDNVDKSIHW